MVRVYDLRRFFLYGTFLILLPVICGGQTGYYGKSNLNAIYIDCPQMDMIHLPGGIILSEQNSAGSYTIGDHLGSVRIIADRNNVSIAAYEYAPYGKGVSSGDRQFNVYTYAGTYNWDARTGLYNTPTRKYDPAAAKFLTTDPLHYNYAPYLFTNANPVNFADRDARAPVPVNDYDDPDMAEMLEHPDIPGFNLDAGSLQTLKLLAPGDAFVGIINVKTGDIYLNPVGRRDPGNSGNTNFWSGKDFNKPISLMGRENVTQIQFSDFFASHVQLRDRVLEYMKEDGINTLGNIGFAGFGIRWETNETRPLITFRSASLNGPAFKNWVRGNSKAAFEAYHSISMRNFYDDLYLNYKEEYELYYTPEESQNRSIVRIENEYGDEQQGILFDRFMEFRTGKKLRSFSSVPAKEDVIRSYLVRSRDGGFLPSYISDRLKTYFSGIDAKLQFRITEY